MTVDTIEREEIQVNTQTVNQECKRTVAIAVDGSKHSNHAVQYAITHLLNKDTDLIILLHCRPTYVIPPWNDVNYNAYHARVEKGYQAESRDILARALAEFKSNGFTHVQAHGIFGDHAKEAIVDFVNVRMKGAVNMLVIGSRGLNKVSATVLGSVSDYCTHHAHCSVLIVRPDMNASIAEKKDVENFDVTAGNPSVATIKAI
ncbi:hypothetical protein BDR26DRAFT_858680 [Obelidium mucronatum]|nr:hypothetical protein BDR26DRAFT_858680 [Obelidium mucronatum]